MHGIQVGLKNSIVATVILQIMANIIIHHYFYTGPPPQPTDLETIAHINSIIITWSQPEGEQILNYEMAYFYVVRECDNILAHYTTLDQGLIDGSARQYTLANSVDTPVEEFSNYTIYLTAVSARGHSHRSLVTATTQQSGAYSGALRHVCVLLYMEKLKMRYL